MYCKDIELLDSVSPYRIKRTLAPRGSIVIVQEPNPIRFISLKFKPIALLKC